MAAADLVAITSHGLFTSGGGGTCDYPAEGDVRFGVDYDFGAMTGTVVLPAEDDVRDGTGYGADGDEFVGTFECDCPEPPVPDPSLIPFAVIAQVIVQRVALALGTSTDWVRPVASDRYPVTITENLFAYVHFMGVTPVDPTTGRPFNDDGAGRYRRVIGRRFRVYIYTRSAEDLTGGDEVALMGTDATQNVTTPPVLPGHFVSEELVLNALDDWTPTFTDPVGPTVRPYTIGPIHVENSEGGPPERPPENDMALLRSSLDFTVCYRAGIQFVEPAPAGLPTPDLSND